MGFQYHILNTDAVVLNEEEFPIKAAAVVDIRNIVSLLLRPAMEKIYDDFTTIIVKGRKEKRGCDLGFIFNDVISIYLTFDTHPDLTRFASQGFKQGDSIYNFSILNHSTCKWTTAPYMKFKSFEDSVKTLKKMIIKSETFDIPKMLNPDLQMQDTDMNNIGIFDANDELIFAHESYKDDEYGYTFKLSKENALELAKYINDKYKDSFQ